MNYNLYEDVLEFLPNEVNTINNLKEFDIFKNICTKFKNIKCNKILVSLSGGVDSMVFCVISKLIKDNDDNFEIVCCHINYNNREESVKERDFLVEWCRYNSINLIVKDIDHIHRRDGNRQKYEEETRNIRYSFYKELIKKHNCYGVVLAHHKDDYSENVFNNIMRGNNNITNLGVLKEENILHDVTVLRPLLKYGKDIIYHISNKFQIPYFLDTTPKWSCRGKMRNEIFPKCKDCYGDIFMSKLHNLGIQSESIAYILDKHLINPILNSVYYGKLGFKIPKIPSLKENLILENVLNNITFKLGLKTIRKKNIKIILEKYNNEVEINLIKDYKCFILKDCILFIKISKINKFFNNKNFIDLFYITYEKLDNVNLINDLLNGKIYYLINKKLSKVATSGNKKDRLKKVKVSDILNKYIPNLFIEDTSPNDESINYLSVDISTLINL
jgi:tRNA(Ile)-lysidine synthetase-like protein